MAELDIRFPGTAAGNAASQAGVGSAFLQPTQGKNLYAGNYLDFTNGTINQWTQQFLPDVYEKEIEIYGNRTISSFLRMVSAEMPSSSDQIIWLEQGRLHTRYANLHLVKAAQAASSALPTAAGDTTATETTVAAGEHIQFQFSATAERGPANGRNVASTTTEGDNEINFRVGQTVMCQVLTGGAEGRGTGPVLKGVVTLVNAVSFEVRAYENVTFAVAGGDEITALVYGSEFAKGTGNFTDKLDPSYSTYQNSPIIMKEHYAINGSDTGQIGWIEVTSENGASGYLWYVKAEHENRLRWEDYQEMAMLEAVPYAGANPGAANADGGLGAFRGDFRADASPVSLAPTNPRGTQGFFHALQERGNVYSGLAGDLAPVAPTFDTTNGGQLTAGTSGINQLDQSFDFILKQLDKQGAIEENMLYVNRDLALAFDNFLATQNNYGGVQGVSWGVFNNSSDMAIDLGFSGFRRGSYDFYKTDWKYLNDWSTRGGFGDIEGVMIPAGTSTVYDQNLGKNIKRPFLHLRYRASETDNRKMKSWITGSVGGAYTTDVDELRMHYLTEKCLITQGANNFFLMTN